MEVLDHLELPLAVLEPEWTGPGAAVRFLTEGEALAAKRRELRPPMAERKAPDRLEAEELRILDTLRVTNPKAAASLASAQVYEAALDGRVRDTALLLARQAAALRLRMDYHGAHACLWWALTLQPDEADFWLRASKVVGDYSDFKDALQLADFALVTFFNRGDVASSARCLSVRAEYLHSLGQNSLSRQALYSALQLLPREMQTHRIAVYQNLGLVYVAEGKLDEAAEALARAVEGGIPPGIHGGNILWLKARIADGRGLRTEAIEDYRLTVARLHASPANAALATCELVRLLLLEGQKEEALLRARGVLAYAQSSESPMVAQVLWELGDAAATDTRRLTVPFVEHTISRIRRGMEKARQQAAARPKVRFAS